jgi:two-component system, NarL family, sensor kinase
MEAWQKPESFALWFAIALGVVIGLAVLIIIINRLSVRRIIFEQQKTAQAKLDYQKKLLKDSILVQERERERIASNLHDDLISKLNIVSLLLHTEKGQLPADPKQLLQESIHLARGISHDLRPPLLKDTSLEELCKDFLGPLRQEFKVNFKLLGEPQDFEEEVKLQLLRVFQEVINNILKHAEATELNVTLRFGLQNFALKVQDNGKGFDTSRQRKGLGLKNIELRMQSLQGSYKFKSFLGRGTTFIGIVKL